MKNKVRNLERDLERHLKCIDIIYDIETFRKYKKSKMESLNNIMGQIPDIRQSLIKMIEGYEIAIDILNERYIGVMSELFPQPKKSAKQINDDFLEDYRNWAGNGNFIAEIEIQCADYVNEGCMLPVDFKASRGDFEIEKYPEGNKYVCTNFCYDKTIYSELEQGTIDRWIDNNKEYICERLEAVYER